MKSEMTGIQNKVERPVSSPEDAKVSIEGGMF